ncbi:MAG: DUF2782 domain-containing protein [Betaproteobacteria bacterium]|nr:DUF2782 domain-containing protein [Betaproteobacteria bacterium]MCL2887000.1 DUF2782 domain-containing protein [Betaproteobacteria bacterium]
MRRLLPLLLLAALPAWAQQPSAQPLPAVPPPPPGMEAFDAALEQPDVTIIKENEGTREEYRLHGKLYMVKITPTVGLPYYLIDRQGDGVFVETTFDAHPIKPPMWVIHSW